MDYNAYNLTPYHIDNLITLARFLASDTIPPPRFDIGNWMILDSDERIHGRALRYAHQVKPEMYNECGTTACAVGHGPLAGIPPLTYEKWTEYSYRAFGVDPRSDQNSDPFEFMFGTMWLKVNKENTARGTAKRIIYFLKHGLPDDFIDTLWYGALEWMEHAPWDDIDVLKESEYLLAV